MSEQTPPTPEPERPRLRCEMPCLKHAHVCDRSLRHTGWHRNVQQKGDHACEWDTPGPKDYPALMTALQSARAELAGERARHGELVAEMQRARTAADDARAEQVRLAEQVRVLAGLLRRGNPKVFCSKHPDHAEPGCEVCRDAGIFRSALGEQDGDQTDG